MTPVLSSTLTRARLVLGGLTDALLPQTCVVCCERISGDQAPTCRECHENLAAVRHVPYCWRCGRAAKPVTMNERGCGQCRGERFWNVGGVARVGGYEPPIRSLIVGLKYHGRERNAAYLGELMAAALRERPWLTELDALVPVPMHRLRRWQRRCDHTALLAAALAKQLGIPVLKGVLREKNTPSQTRITSRAQRFANVRGCFAARRPQRVRDKTVCIVDNLIATGATVHEVSKVLRKAGAKRIYAAVVARSVIPSDSQAEGLTSPDTPPDQTPSHTRDSADQAARSIGIRR
jgi:competence protein ComFC